MNCQTQTENVTCPRTSNNGFLIIVVLYILLAIIIGSRSNAIF